ncbi:hypothetical protein ACJ5H2_01470 [Nocardioides sp. R1-1]|uniref:hypothetical protein n=1 Tax=Nocardioides sp. R1-1 TaxID=3383502 RepID=UPI0038D22B44
MVLWSGRARRTAAALATAALVAAPSVSGCSGPDGTAADGEPITPAAIAAVTREHVALEPTAVSAWDVLGREIGDPGTGAQLDLAEVSLAVGVAPTSDSPLVCADESFFDACVATTIGGHDVTLGWQELEPEEDPGVVYVIDRREEEDVLVRVSGPSVTGDPRTLDLGVTLETLAAVATDRRLSLTTTPDVLDLGDSVEMAD